MIKDKERVIEKLYNTILGGCDPYYAYESACDHGVDWTVLTKEEFGAISKKAREEREKRKREKPNKT